MKKIFSIMLSMLLIAGLIPTFANTYSEDMAAYGDMTSGEKLQATGFVDGDPDGSLDEDRPLTRAEATKLIDEMYGAADIALSADITPTYPDAQDGWYSPYIGYAEVMGWVSGYPDGTFRPNNTISAQEWTAMLLNVLGYPYTWETAIPVAASLGIYVDAANPDAITRGEAFDAMWEAVWTPPYGSDVPLGILLGNIPSTQPDNPKPNPEPEDLMVNSVETSNLVQTKIMFNKKLDVDSAQDIDNYSLDDDDDDDVSIYDANLLSDNMTVVLSHHSFDQQGTATLNVSGVKTADETMLVQPYSMGVTYLDQTIPQVISSDIVGSDKIKVTFSEPMNDGYEIDNSTPYKTPTTFDSDDFEITNNGETLYLSDGFVSQDNNTEVILDLYSELEPGNVTLSIAAGPEDYAAFSVVPYNTTMKVVTDTTPPSVMSYENATISSVTLIWTEDISLIHGAGSSNSNLYDSDGDPYYYHTNSSNVASSVAVDGNKLKLTFDANDELPQGTAYVYVSTDAVEDYYGNEANQQMIAVQVELDTTAPTVEDYDIDNSNSYTIMTIDFSENMNESSVEEVDNYTLLNSNGSDVTREYLNSDNDFRYYNANGNDDAYVKISFDGKLSGDYSLILDGLEDLAGNDLNDTINFNANDETAPNPNDWTATYYPQDDGQQLVVIDYGEPMAVDGPYSVIDYNNYIIDGYELSDYEDGVSFNTTESNSVVEITINDSDHDGFDLDFGPSNPSVPIVIGRVADANGNYTTNFSNTIYLNGATSKLEFTAEVTKTDEIKIEFDTIVDFETSDFDFYNGSNNVTNKIATVNETVEDNKTAVVFEFNSEIFPYDAVTDSDTTNKESGSVYVDTDSDPETEDPYGNTVEEDTSISAVDKVAPAVVENDDDEPLVYGYDLNGNGYLDTITIEYTETLGSSYISYSSYLVDEGNVTSIHVMDTGNPTTNTIVNDGKYIEIIIDDTPGADDLITFDLDYTTLSDVEQQYSIYDSNDNPLYPEDQSSMPIIPMATPATN